MTVIMAYNSLVPVCSKVSDSRVTLAQHVDINDMSHGKFTLTAFED